MDPLPIEERLELCLTQFTSTMVEQQLNHSDHIHVARQALDTHSVNATDRIELEELFYQRVSLSTKTVPKEQRREKIIHLNRPRLETHVRLSDAVIDRAIASGTITERPAYQPLFEPTLGID